MKYGKVELGQIEALINKVGGEENLRAILRGDKVVTVTIRTREFLRPAGEITLPATDGVNPDEFYRTREGLYIWPEFRDRIVSAAEQIALPETTLHPFDLVKAANDGEIRAELPENHVFTASEFCARLAQMLDAQPHGEEGDLLTNGSASFFYVRGVGGDVRAVHVYRHSVDREWGVDAHPLVGLRWYGGNRAFSATAV